MTIQKIEGLARFKNYDVKVVFEDVEDSKNKTYYRMSIFFNDNLVYITKRNAFKIDTRNLGEKIQLKHFMFWKNIERNPTIDKYLKWDSKEFSRYYNWRRNIKISSKIEKAVQEEKRKFEKSILNKKESKVQ